MTQQLAPADVQLQLFVFEIGQRIGGCCHCRSNALNA